ncbi:DivIVA domain-containing protein [Paractinoplanes atraurantiacus]|uniref:Cell wall synthesis protein Wag31 n=1 Tax=Paractinoplanes atraurantiacus TaxID=1036182 RepID=A0A285KBU3_9ACTN|nr:DivIVA domain-containing protein [Actinoplanes atraurantiacus]SNY70062.1 DivIVA domain-containing protein [Actinoplanes atraurantiacus]
MPLTPADIHNMAFKKPAIGKRGYDEEDVDAFLDEVEQELIRLIEENRALADQAQRNGGGMGPGPSGPSAGNRAMEAELQALTTQLGRMQEARARAEQNARSVQSQLERARTERPATPPPAEKDDRLSAVLMMAQRTADDHMRDAQQEADSLLGNARTQSEQITGDALLAADNIQADARRNHSDALASIDEKRDALLDEIDRLGQLARTYQQALGQHVQQQLQELDSVSNGAGRDLD